MTTQRPLAKLECNPLCNSNDDSHDDDDDNAIYDFIFCTIHHRRSLHTVSVGKEEKHSEEL